MQHLNVNVVHTKVESYGSKSVQWREVTDPTDKDGALNERTVPQPGQTY